MQVSSVPYDAVRSPFRRKGRRDLLCLTGSPVRKAVVRSSCLRQLLEAPGPKVLTRRPASRPSVLGSLPTGSGSSRQVRESAPLTRENQHTRFSGRHLAAPVSAGAVQGRIFAAGSGQFHGSRVAPRRTACSSDSRSSRSHLQHPPLQNARFAMFVKGNPP